MIRSHKALILMALVWIAVNLMTLSAFPRPHGDEGYLSNLAYVMSEKGMTIVDERQSNIGFFQDMHMSYIGGSFFFGALALFGLLSDFNFFVLRLQPLFFSLVLIFLTYAIGLELFKRKEVAFLGAFFLAFSTKFLLTSHTIRQEPMFMANFLSIFLLLLFGLRQQKYRCFFLAAFLTGAAPCIHPNGLFMPIIFLPLFFLLRQNRSKYPTLLLWGCLLSCFLGLLLFLFLDYLPNEHYYLELFKSRFYHQFQFVNRHLLLLHSPFTILLDFLKAIWSYYWDSRYHQFLFYLVLHVFAIGGALAFKTRATLSLLWFLLLLLILVMTLHINTIYFAYFLPALSLLLAQTLFSVMNRNTAESSIKLTQCDSLVQPSAGRALSGCQINYRLVSNNMALPSIKNGMPALILVMSLYLLHPALTLISFRNHNPGYVVNQFKKHVDLNQNVLSSDVYFFQWPRGHLFSSYLMIDSDLKQLMRSVGIRYFILDSDTSSLIDQGSYRKQNIAFLNQECVVASQVSSFVPALLQPAYTGDPISLYDCKRK